MTTLAILWQGLLLIKVRRVSQTAIAAIVLNERLQDEIDEHQRTRAAIRHMALHDELTGLGNRRYFEEASTRTLSRAAREQSSFGVLAVDLNNFKPINDRHGHAAGDAVLKAVARRLLGSIRGGDFCARMGGDEFSIIVAGVHAASDAVDVADKLRGVLAEPFAVDDLAVQVGASVGWAVYPNDGVCVSELLLLADQRMYRDKQLGSEAAKPAAA